MDDVEVRATMPISPDAQAPRRARRFISEFCTAAHVDEELCQLATLLTSELVTNAIKYGRSRAVLEAHMPGALLRISVADDNPDLPLVGDAPDLTAEGGRGVLLVSSLASRWGVERLTSGGKAVWFELDLQPVEAGGA